MRKHWTLAGLLLTGALLATASNRAQAQWDVSGYASRQDPSPFGQDRPDEGGFYGALEFLFVSPSRAIGHQEIAVRGFVDSDGSVTGTQGTFIGSRRDALDTTSFGKTTFVPGFRASAGYRFEDGATISYSYAHLASAVYSAGAGPIPVDFNTGGSGQDAFLFSPVFNFNPQFSGPQNRLADATGIIGSGGSPYGIWNGANTMDIKYTQRFTDQDITYRAAVLETDYSRTYSLAGGRFAWIWERFGWNTTASDFQGLSGSQDAANYVNIMSQRMYGPFLGVGNDVYLGSAFSLSADVTVASLFAIVKQEAKYTLGDDSISSKRAGDQFALVPNVNLNMALSWFPLAGVQLKAGYNFWSFFNSYYMSQPVGFNAAAPDPAYNHRAIRFFQGLNFGVSIAF